MRCSYGLHIRSHISILIGKIMLYSATRMVLANLSLEKASPFFTCAELDEGGKAYN